MTKDLIYWSIFFCFSVLCIAFVLSFDSLSQEELAMSIQLLCYLVAVIFCLLAFLGVGRFNWLAGAIGLVILAAFVIR